MLYAVHCTLYTLRCTLYAVHSTLYTVRCTLYAVLCRVLYPVSCIQYPVSSIHCGLKVSRSQTKIYENVKEEDLQGQTQKGEKENGKFIYRRKEEDLGKQVALTQNLKVSEEDSKMKEQILEDLMKEEELIQPDAQKTKRRQKTQRAKSRSRKRKRR